MSLPDEIREDVIRAVLTLARDRSWESLTLAEIAEAAGLGLDALHGTSGKAAIGDAIEPWLDQAMSEEAVGLDPQASPRERLFDVIMLRFEAMEPWRDGLTSLMRWRERSPDRLARLLAARRRSAHWALVSAGLGHGAHRAGLAQRDRSRSCPNHGGSGQAASVCGGTHGLAETHDG